jgi:hypothetical protein
MARLDIKEWAKTVDGVETIQAQKPFCVGGQIWQGMDGAAFRCPEDVLTTDELKNAPDKDGTLSEVWRRRRQRLEWRIGRKQEDYDKTRRLLRQERNEIREAMKSDAEAKIPINPDDLEQIKRIDKRMARLNAVESESEAEISKMIVDGGTPERKTELDDAQKAPKPKYTCPRCEKEPPPDHPRPHMWLKGHNVQCSLKHKKAS